MLVWALQHRNQEEGVGCEELLSSVCSLMTSSTKDIEVKDSDCILCHLLIFL